MTDRRDIWTDVLEAHVPELDPWRDAAVLALHSHVADAPCDETCSVYDRRPT